MTARSSLPQVVHYRDTYLSLSETFIHEVVRRHERYAPLVVTHETRNEERFALDGPVVVAPEEGPGRQGSLLSSSAALRIRARRRAIRRTLRSLEPAILHAHFGEEGVVATAEAAGFSIPVVVSFYGFDATHLGAHVLWRHRFRHLFRRARMVLAEGPHLRRRLVELGSSPERTRIQRIPVRLERFPYRPRSRPESGRVVFLQACRLVEKKGVDLTVEAFARLAPAWPEAEMWILGDGPERHRIQEQVAQAGLGNRVRLLGMRDHEAYAAVMAEAHIFVQPSRTASNGDGEGGAPTTLLEAQASGLPVVTSDHADIPFVVSGEGALVVPEGSVDALVEAMNHMLDHPEEWGSRAEAGRRKVEADHSPAPLVSRLEALYDEARGAQPRSGRRFDRSTVVRDPAVAPSWRAGGETGRRRPEGGTRLVSVVLPTRDRAEVLGRALESALGQTLTDLEVIVVDDGSTDGTADVLRDYRRLDSRVVVLSHDSPLGAGAARNRGIEHAHGGYVAFLDDDDEWFRTKLERQVGRLDGAGPDVSAAYGPYVLRREDGRDELGWVADVSGQDPLRRLVRGAFIGTPSLLVRRASLQAVGGFDPALPRLQDWDLCLRLARITRFSFCPEPLLRAHATPDSVSKRDEHIVEACRIIRRKAGGWPELGIGGLADLDYTLAHLLMVGNRTREARQLFRRSLKAAPSRPRRWLMASLAHLSPTLYEAVADLHRHWVSGRAEGAAADAAP